ncbi:hypothetical protein H9Q08_19425 [Chryseobacterium sp. PS-8]|uniref:Uncharacterized protein n=1 Tax=Chryseobacterium indicum TaxID=2766954 RepID=A0ABS9CB86_9FLAO|nr:hypothetical protein [Chryseobacterium sp. PS-8]MCF2221439.1 hypothetical protein [Chryseobacterium sp. PS-8]
MQQKDEDRRLVIALKNYAKLIHLSSPPKFENDQGIITKSGINRMIKWCKQDRHLIQYARDRNNFNLDDEEKQVLVTEIIKMIS